MTKMRLSFFSWLYYHCYRYSERANTAPHWANAAIYFLLLLQMNVIAIAFAVRILADRTTAIPGSLIWWSALVTAGVTISYVAFMGYNGRYRRTIARYSNKDPQDERRSEILFTCYFLGSFVAFIGAFFALAIHAGGVP